MLSGDYGTIEDIKFIDMIIQFQSIPENDILGFKGGEGMMHSRAYFDGTNRIMLNRLESGASAGEHLHDVNCEFIYVIEGELSCIENGRSEVCHAGELHYCLQGDKHSYVNTSDSITTFLAIVPAQPPK